MTTARQINIFLPDGNPSGVKIAEVANRNIRAVVVPRAEIANAKSYRELSQPAIYILSDRESSQVYIGECENFVHRIKSHDQQKDFWEIALAFVSKDNGLEKGDVKFLEAVAVESAKDAQRMEVLNSTAPARNNLHEFKAQTILEFFDDLKLLVSTLGFPVFDKVQLEEAKSEQVWYCNVRTTNATAVYDGSGFTVLKGSLIDAHERPSFEKSYPDAAKRRRNLLASKAKRVNEDTYEVQENITFTSANQAGSFCVGGHMNAWTTWKDAKGKTMDKVLRGSL